MFVWKNNKKRDRQFVRQNRKQMGKFSTGFVFIQEECRFLNVTSRKTIFYGSGFSLDLSKTDLQSALKKVPAQTRLVVCVLVN